MSRLIIICGLPGTGKTLLSNELSKKTSIFCIHKDTIKESLYKTMGLSSLEDSKKIGYPSIKVMLDVAGENVSRGIDVILEAPFTFPDEGLIFSQWKEKYNLSVYSIILNLDGETRKSRFLNRQRDPCHHDNERIDPQPVVETKFEHMPEKRIILTTNKSIDQLIDDILAIIKL